MTAIAYRDGIMAADSGVWSAGGRIVGGEQEKIFRHPEGGIFSGCGRTSEIHRVRRWLLGKDEKPIGVMDIGLEIMWVKPDRSIWLMENDLVFFPVPGAFKAIGSPEQFMWGALHAGATAGEAVMLAILHTDGAAGKVTTMKVDI